jgi:hypothetical protein
MSLRRNYQNRQDLHVGTDASQLKRLLDAEVEVAYFVRTSSGGSGAITVKITPDFSTGGGPSVANPPTTGDALTYVGTGDQPGAGGAATYNRTGTAPPAVPRTWCPLESKAQSLKAGNAASVAWTLTNDPAYAQGTYNSAVATFTISAS